MTKKKKQIIESVISNMCYSCYSVSHDLPLSIGYKIGWRNIYIYTNYPGYLIGFKGKRVNEAKLELYKNNINKNIVFIEIGYRYPMEIKFTYNPLKRLYRKIFK